jgi:DNA-directed RNA polymerase specialized sigma24 family protein
MSESGTELDLSSFEGMVGQVAYSVGRHFPFVDLEDLRQELWLWLVEHQEKVQVWGQEATGDRRTAKSLRRAARAVCLDLKAQRGGYDLGDLWFYSVGQLRQLLPDVLDTEGWTASSPALSPDRVQSQSLVNEGNNRLAMLVDVKDAFLRLADEDQQLLYVHYRVHEEEQHATELEISVEALRSRVTRALTRLQRELGGPQPDVEWVGTRRAMSNATAQALTRSAYEEET